MTSIASIVKPAFSSTTAVTPPPKTAETDTVPVYRVETPAALAKYLDMTEKGWKKLFETNNDAFLDTRDCHKFDTPGKLAKFQKLISTVLPPSTGTLEIPLSATSKLAETHAQNFSNYAKARETVRISIPTVAAIVLTRTPIHPDLTFQNHDKFVKPGEAPNFEAIAQQIFTAIQNPLGKQARVILTPEYGIVTETKFPNEVLWRGKAPNGLKTWQLFFAVDPTTKALELKTIKHPITRGKH